MISEIHVHTAKAAGIGEDGLKGAHGHQGFVILGAGAAEEISGSLMWTDACFGKWGEALDDSREKGLYLLKGSVLLTRKKGVSLE